MPCPRCPHCIASGAYGMIDRDDPALRGAPPRAARPTRYVLEGTWSGYHSSQRQVAHREVIKPFRVEGYSKIKTIRYTDGTTMEVKVRPCAPREKVEEKLDYKRMLEAAYYHKLEGFIDVEKIKL